MRDESSESDGTEPPARAGWVRRVLDWRIWLGLAITIVSITNGLSKFALARPGLKKKNYSFSHRRDVIKSDE